MIVPILHLATCLLLVGASIYWIVRRKDSSGCHRFLFPFIITSGTAGSLLIISPLLEVWIAYFNGAIYEREALNFRFTGPYWWVYSFQLAFPLLPLLGIHPYIGRRARLMAGIGVISMVPDLFLLLAPALFSFSGRSPLPIIP